MIIPVHAMHIQTHTHTHTFEQAHTHPHTRTHIHSGPQAHAYAHAHAHTPRRQSRRDLNPPTHCHLISTLAHTVPTRTHRGAKDAVISTTHVLTATRACVHVSSLITLISAPNPQTPNPKPRTPRVAGARGAVRAAGGQGDGGHAGAQPLAPHRQLPLVGRPLSRKRRWSNRAREKKGTRPLVDKLPTGQRKMSTRAGRLSICPLADHSRRGCRGPIDPHTERSTSAGAGRARRRGRRDAAARLPSSTARSRRLRSSSARSRSNLLVCRARLQPALQRSRNLLRPIDTFPTRSTQRAAPGGGAPSTAQHAVRNRLHVRVELVVKAARARRARARVGAPRAGRPACGAGAVCSVCDHSPACSAMLQHSGPASMTRGCGAAVATDC